MDRRSERLITPPMLGKSGTVIDAKMSLGMFLRSGRANKGFSLADVAKITKIQPRILERLEAGKLDGLPAEVFVRGFVRSFAKCVGIDEAEALVRYAAALGNATAPTLQTARAFVDSMQELAPTTSGLLAPVILSSPAIAAPIAAPLGDLHSGDATHPDVSGLALDAATLDAELDVEIEIAPVEIAHVVPVVDATVATASAIAGVEVAAAPAGEAQSESGGKKKRTRRARGTITGAAPKGNKRKAAATGTPAEAMPVVAGPSEHLKAVEVEPPAEPVVEVDPVVEVEVEVQTDSVAASAAASAADDLFGEPAQGIDVEVVRTPVTMSQPWSPKMPTVTSTVPWRRPALGIYGRTASTPLVPSLVIDDSDPDSAERELEDRVAAKEPARKSFLPPILTDGAKHAQGQGTLTLAVIILLIAATLTLSYLMRRPSSGGDGVTRVDGTVELIG